jgi:protein PhnA
MEVQTNIYLCSNPFTVYFLIGVGACGHEWPVNTAINDEEEKVDYDGIIWDINGNLLEIGNTVVLTKELGKGLKKGLKVTRIRLGDYGDGHDVEASIPGLGTFLLKSQFLKKAGK